jgi:hypothetical protein
METEIVIKFDIKEPFIFDKTIHYVTERCENGIITYEKGYIPENAEKIITSINPLIN